MLLPAMPSSVISGRLRAVEGDVIILGSGRRIVVPPSLSIETLPVGCSVTVVFRQEPDGRLVAESITGNDD
jgi:hypothetical protein